MQITIVTATVRPEGLRKVVQCIEEQTHKDWHHIVVNNNREPIKRIYPAIRNKKRVMVDVGVDTGHYGGFSRNVGAMLAFSYFSDRRRDYDDEWVCFLDDDNLWYPHHLETLVRGHEENPEAMLIGVDAEIRSYKDKEYKHILSCKIVHQNCDLGNFLYNRKMFEKYGYFRPRRERKITYDLELIQKIAKGEKVHIVHKPTFIVYHRQR